MPTGTNGSDVFFFEGTLGQLVMTIVNPYTGETILLDDVYNINSSFYDGLGGNDVLLMTDFGDAVFLEGTSGQQTIKNIEVFTAGNGGDAIVLSSSIYTLGNTTIDGGLGNDVLWANNGNDRINGSDGDDTINGGGGNDTLNGGNHNDHLTGALGLDILNGEAGDDTLVFTLDAYWTSAFGVSSSGGASNAGAYDVTFTDTHVRTTDTFNGGAGIDTLLGSVGGDVILLQDGLSGRHSSSSGARLVSVEIISAGDGNDIVDLKSSLYTYGNVTLHGGAGNDWLRSGGGNDSLNGGAGTDHLYAGDGDDLIYASADEVLASGYVDLSDVVAGLTGMLSMAGLFVTQDSFDGGNGFDMLHLTGGADYFSYGQVSVTGIEKILAGNGNDVLDLGTLTENITVLGEYGDDTIMLSAVDSLAYGGEGNDVIAGLAGNDQLFGDLGNDTLSGGLGNDYIVGGDGDDVLYGGNNDGIVLVDKDFHDPIAFPGLREGVNITNLVPPGDPSRGVVDGNLDINFDTTATITFRQGYAGYNNTLGVYSIAADGTIQSASILWANVKTAGLNTAHTIDLPTGENGAQLGFFIIADGDNVNNHYRNMNITGDGVIRFVYDYGLATERDAKVTDAASRVKVVYDDGVLTRVLNGDDYHTTDRGASAGINGDNKVHIVSGLAQAGNDDVLRIGFEDLRYTGDADYEDVLFDLNINSTSYDLSEVGNDVLIGGAGNDTFYGEAGDDILVVGLGADRIYGGSGSDTIAYDVLDTLVDTIFGFEKGSGGDVLNLSALLENFDAGDSVSNFVRLATGSGGTQVQVNADGHAGGAFTTIAVIDGGVGSATLNDLLSQGNLVLNSPVSV